MARSDSRLVGKGRGMTRRDFLSGSAAVGLVASSALSCSQPRFGGRLNVLFVIVDDLNDFVGCLGGHPDVRTPHLDALAARAVLFENAHCPAPVCNPSRVSVLSGLSPVNHRVHKNRIAFRHTFPDLVTLPQWFQAHDYDVLGVGKTFHMRDVASWDDYLLPDRPPRYKPPIGGINDFFDFGAVDVGVSDMVDGQVVDWAVEKLAVRRQRPLFLAAGFLSPHLPWHVPRSHWERHGVDPQTVALPPAMKDDLKDLSKYARRMTRSPRYDHAQLREKSLWRRAVAGYLDAVSFFDVQLGRLLGAWEAEGYAENGLVVLWSDHGFHLGEKDHWRKTTLWERSTRVPFLISGPQAGIRPGVCRRPVNLVPIYRTLSELCGLEDNPQLEGRSLVPLLENPEASWDEATVTTMSRSHAVRSEAWRYIRYVTGDEELYDRRVDPHEWHNLASLPEHDEIKSHLARFLPETAA